MGSILLICVVVIGVGVVGVLLTSHPTPHNLPAISATISEDTTNSLISIYNDGGDPVSHDEIQILVDGVPQELDNGGTSDWSTWSSGQTLTYQYTGSAPGLIQIVYTGGSGATVIASADFGFNPSGTLTTGPTGSATSTPTGNTTTPVPGPVANFTASPLTGIAPLTVQFTDLSTNAPTSWSWNFGDGNTANSTVQNPVHTYANPGNYTVSLTVTNSWGSNTRTKIKYITVNPLPSADFTGTPTAGSAPLQVNFSATSSGTPTAWSWSFGDGNTTGASQQNPVHLYTVAGNYTVSLTTTYPGSSNTTTKTNYIQVTNGFVNFIIDQNVFVYGNALDFAGGQVTGPDATIVITGPLSTSDLNGGASVAVKTIYIDGNVYLDQGSAGLGAPSNTGAIYVNGDMTLWNGQRDIYGTVYVAGNFNLKDAMIHGTVYVNGDVTLGNTPTLDSNSYIYYTGTLSVPPNYNHPEIVAKCIKQATVPPVTMPDQTIAPVKSDDWYQDHGYSTSTSSKLSNNLKIIANSFTSSDSSDTPGVTNIVIIAKTGDITLDGYWQHYPVTGVLYAPNGKVTFSGGAFTGVVIARDGFYVTSGSTTVTFTNLATYFSDPNDYPF